MIGKMKLSGKITLLVLTLVVLATATLLGLTYAWQRHTTEQAALDRLQLLARQRAERVAHWQALVGQQLRMIASQCPDTPDASLDLLENAAQAANFSTWWWLDTQQQVVYAPEGTPALQASAHLFAPLPEARAYFGYWRPSHNARATVAYPLFDAGQALRGWWVAQADIALLLADLTDTTDLGQTGEAWLVRAVEDEWLLQHPSRLRPDLSWPRLADFATDFYQHAQTAHLTDSRAQQVLAASCPVPLAADVKPTLAVVVKRDRAEVLADLHRAFQGVLLGALALMLLVLVVVSLVAHFFAQPLNQLSSTMQLLSQGVLPEPIRQRSGDEFGHMANTLNQLTDGLKRTADFANRIGEGNFEANFEPMSREDTLGLALLGMRDSLQQAEQSDNERNWIVRGVAELGDILRRHNEIGPMGDEVIAFVTQKIGAVQGAFYTLETPENDRACLQMQASYAYHKKKYLTARFRVGEGLVGQAAAEADTILRTEVPADYVTITSGLLGEKRPSCVLIVPLITNEEVNGALEFAGFERFSEKQVRFVQEVSQIIARTLFNIQVNERTRNLLTASQQMSQELQQQQEELRQNAEEMAATQEELRRTNNELGVQMQEVSRTQKRMQVLLENASEVITIYEKEGTVRYISPSVERILGYEPDELIGIKDIVHVAEEHRKAVGQAFAQLLTQPDEAITLQLPYTRKSGEVIWLEATFTNHLDDPALQGILVNSRDITERRLAERESRMRGQMQALSENSPDLITRLNRDGVFFYTNPVIEYYTGQKPDYFHQKSLQEVNLPGDITTVLADLLQEVIEEKDKIRREVDVATVDGGRVMQVNAIPEYNEENMMESVLLVSHDITERKQIEREIESKNKKITESINYAKRIQHAILPDSGTLQSVFADSFMLYKPRDVVSGDFPWFMRTDEAIHLAAVDCTGHGVPGALISLIGYFILNDVVSNGGYRTPGQMLDALDAGVTTTLRQSGADGATRDGMDIAFCTVRPDEKRLYYAGAHRPLYWIRNGELHEVKGDKFPVGGGQYANRTAFVTHEIAYEPGDVVLIFSDGYPDQFGGPDNRKLSPKRIRETFVAHAQAPMAEMHAAFEQLFDQWRGTQKQTDDVLMLGWRF